LINLGAPAEENLHKSREAFREEVRRCIQLGISFLNFHPGAALTSDRQLCLDRICESIMGVRDLMEKSSLRLLIENTAGQGSTIGSCFEELAYLIQKLHGQISIGVCIDTCHAFVSGYDLRTAEACDTTFKEFDAVVGLEHLYAFHMNDSMKPLGSRVDRHADLGKGEIGLECFRFLMKDQRTRLIPKYLETPGGTSVWKEEIALLREFGRKS